LSRFRGGEPPLKEIVRQQEEKIKLQEEKIAMLEENYITLKETVSSLVARNINAKPDKNKTATAGTKRKDRSLQTIRERQGTSLPIQTIQ